MKRVQVLLRLIATILIACWSGCSKPGNSIAIAGDSTRTFREIVEHSPGRLGLSKTELAGKIVFTKYCQVCHGAEGDGKGFNAFNLQNSFGTQPANFTDSTTLAALSEETIITAISKGGKAVGKSQYMPPWGGTLRTEEVENVAAYIKTLAKMLEKTESSK
ncbi:MAG: cytochrome c [Ignavibacteriae bacterium]|nr:cytochrome c [Ignavibacteriota bacterium]